MSYKKPYTYVFSINNNVLIIIIDTATSIKKLFSRFVTLQVDPNS